MPDKHEGCIRGFHHTGAAWYGKAVLLGRDVVDEVMIGMYHPDGGTTGEFSVKWCELGGKITPKLGVYDDAWNALERFGDVLAAMAKVDGQNIAPEAFCELLKGCGLVDRTERRQPGGAIVTEERRE